MTRPVSVTIPHRLGKAEARRRIDAGFARLGAQMGGGPAAQLLAFDQRWEQERLLFQGKALGQTVRGHLDVLDEAVHIEIELPSLLAALAEKIAARLEKEGRRLLEHR